MNGKHYHLDELRFNVEDAGGYLDKANKKLFTMQIHHGSSGSFISNPKTWKETIK